MGSHSDHESSSSNVQQQQQQQASSPSKPSSPHDRHHHHHNTHSHDGHHNQNHHHTCSVFIQQFEALSSSTQFLILASGVFLFFGVHNLLQEAIMAEPNFSFGIMLGYMEVLGVTVCSLLERTYIAKEGLLQRVAPFSAYPLLTACLVMSSALSNMSLNYINFPTKVVFRSCKLIPTMVMASVIHRKVFTSVEYICAFAICVGLVLFAAADWELRPSFHPIGLLLVSLSVCADAILPNAQERLFQMNASRLEVTFFTNIFTLLFMTASTLLSGDFMGALRQTVLNPKLQLYFGIYTFIAYLAISLHMTVVKRFGGVAAVLLATGRKGMTLVLSFLLFPKSFSWFYPVGATFVLGGLLASSLLNKRGGKSNHKGIGGGSTGKEKSSSFLLKGEEVESLTAVSSSSTSSTFPSNNNGGHHHSTSSANSNPNDSKETIMRNGVTHHQQHHGHGHEKDVEFGPLKTLNQQH